MEQQFMPATPIVTTSVKLVIGLFFTAFGALMALDNLDVIYAPHYLRYWPAVLVVIGLLKLGDATNRGLAIVAIVAGTLMLAVNARWIHFSIFNLWPLILIGIGVFIVTQAVGFRPDFGSSELGPNIWAVLSTRKIAVTSQNFTGGRIVAVMGGCEMDLTAADIEHGPAVLEVLVMMGGVELHLPDGWEVAGDAVPFMGGIEIKTKSKAGDRQLIVRGLVMWGGMEIRDAAARTK
jgi:predicted membrane protein